MRTGGIIMTLAAAAFAASVWQCADAAGKGEEVGPYVWKSVQIVGGGFCDGIVFNPKAKDVRYARTDMGGAYRWDRKQQRWMPMLDFISYADNNLVGVESIAVDPNDSKTVYLDCGTYTSSTNGAIFWSHDGGLSFGRTDVPFKMGGNENGRGNGERMAVDPNNSDIIYVGTRQAGLWRSTDKALHFEQVASFQTLVDSINAAAAARQQPEQTDSPFGRGFGQRRMNQGCGVVFVLFDKDSRKGKEGSQTIFAGYSAMNRANMFVSRDGGATWSVMEGAPQQYMPNHGVMSSDRRMYVSYGTNPGPQTMTDGGVWVYDIKSDTWSDITPDKPTADRRFGYACVSVDLRNPRHIIASSFGRPMSGESSSEDIFRSTDGGKTWKGVFAGGGKYDESKAPYVIHTGIHWLFDIEIDPFNSDHAMFTTGYGGWETFNLGEMDKDRPTLWTVMSTGIEETVPLELYSPTKGAWLISGIGDYGGFTHHDLDKPASDSHHDPRFGNTNAVAGAELKPEIVVRAGTIHGGYRGKNISYSLDGGDTWAEPDSVPLPNGRNGHVAVSSDGSTWVWTPDRSPVFYTDDMGRTWDRSDSIESGIRVIADKVNPKRFYAVNVRTGILYESLDGARTFHTRPIGFAATGRGGRGDSRGGQDRVYSAPGREGDLWIAAFDGLYHAADGVNFVRQGHVDEMHGFGFGAPAPDSDYPALYMVGTVDGVRGFFRSDDCATSWVRINDDLHQYGLVLHITGDPKKYGRVYVGTHGRGAVYGDPR